MRKRQKKSEEEPAYVPIVPLTDADSRRSTRVKTAETDVYGAPTVEPKEDVSQRFVGAQKLSQAFLGVTKTWYQNAKMLFRIALIGSLGGFLYLYVKYDQDYGVAWGRIQSFWIRDVPVFLSEAWQWAMGLIG